LFIETIHIPKGQRQLFLNFALLDPGYCQPRNRAGLPPDMKTRCFLLRSSGLDGQGRSPAAVRVAVSKEQAEAVDQRRDATATFFPSTEYWKPITDSFVIRH